MVPASPRSGSGEPRTVTFFGFDDFDFDDGAISQDAEQEADSGEVSQEFDVSWSSPGVSVISSKPDPFPNAP